MMTAGSKTSNDTAHRATTQPRLARWAAGLAMAAACAGAIGTARAADTVTVGLGIPLTVDSGGVYAIGYELGFFKEENLDVKTLVFQGAGALLPQVATKAITIGLPLPEPVLSSYETGKSPLPVVYFYNAIPANEIELAVLADGPIKTIKDLKGKKIGVGALTWGTIPGTRALLRQEGLTPGKDVEIVPVGILGPGFQALKDGRIDALNYNSLWHTMLEFTGVKIRRLEYPPTFRNMNSNGFITHQDTLRDNPQLLARFGRAYTKSLIACDANPQRCVEAFWRLQPDSKPKTDNPAQALEQAITLTKLRMGKALRTPDGKTRVPGQFDLQTIQKFVVAMHQAGEFNTDKIPVDKIFSNQLVQQFSEFDIKAVQARALATQ
ncbi:ABC transporter substrate-binding protein [Bordetella sp. LUAb4]|uniref:ABC transporter substrate-binding protein n=1 Tax=Bordetella sp. LUAb4 TaxID=2843195 RepID=UPI001E5FDAB5|nr:ABC transporter substrate-binding protein [Bordetella sp. LUAb4]